MDHILEIKDLSTHFFTRAGTVKAVDAVSFAIERGSTLALVGESGSGKSVTSLSIMRLVQPPGKSVAGEIIFNGRDLMKLEDDEMRRIRGREIAMIFQDPMTSLNPVYTVGDQIAEAIQLHEKLGQVGRLGAGRGDDAACQNSRRAPPRRRLSLSTFGRHAPEGDDSDGAFLQS